MGDKIIMINHKIPDFISLFDNKVIEFFGKHWHPKEDEEKRKRLFKQDNYDCLVIWDHELKNKDGVIEKIYNFTFGGVL